MRNKGTEVEGSVSSHVQSGLLMSCPVPLRLWLKSNDQKSQRRAKVWFATLLRAVWATAAVPVLLPGLKHLLATNIQTLQGSCLCGLIPNMCQSPCCPRFPRRHYPCRQKGRYAGMCSGHSCSVGTAGGRLAPWQLGPSGDMCHSKESGDGVSLGVEMPTKHLGDLHPSPPCSEPLCYPPQL